MHSTQLTMRGDPILRLTLLAEKFLRARASEGSTLHLPHNHYFYARAPTKAKASNSRRRLCLSPSTLKGHILSHLLLIFPLRHSDWICLLNSPVTKQLEFPHPLVTVEEMAINKEPLPGLAPPYRDWTTKLPHMTNGI